jgi:hypothetical protein
MLHLLNNLNIKDIFRYRSMRAVNIFMAQRPVGNPNSVSILYKAFGTNIPHYLSLEGGDYNGPQYLFCIDRNIDFESICDKYQWRYYPAYKFEVEEEKYNNSYQIHSSYYSKEQPYRLDKYTPSGYDSD